MSTVFKALSDPTRRRVLELLRERPMTAGELAAEFDVSKPTMSAHFTVLKDANLVDATKDGKSVIYRIKLSVLEDALLGFAAAFGLCSTSDTEKEETG
ncbi:MAG: winged helix-turn-helix transcriptional regulator [Maricaulis sp.]|uniref:autorepressor SdpR family transcription factor n=1 Tax=Maricaulis sp. TaxID=1486257 RepID=UPI001B2E342C|nr:autorepressor SdpR family transcription factor [Maricaulis sp.]MBO6730495.1 winged helix-turn-helix transcriptional regulator [Maricaulis sp.]MBO6846526.1 winged helix-turn-helix transcriptional regulator [Maricaulis sp.]MBO6876757.1 winged helix-turn-helix transcriptional regulator [Maricaulis sp.]